MSLEDARRNDEIIALGDREVMRFIDEINGLDVQATEEKIKTIRREIRSIQKMPKSLANKRRIKALYSELDRLQFKPDYVAVIMDRMSDFKKLNTGFKINGLSYKRLIGTTNGVKKSTIIYASEISNQGKIIHKELARRLDNDRDLSIKLVPAKFEAYKSLSCSTSTSVSMPKGILVVDDVFTHFRERVINLDDGNSNEPVMTVAEQEVELNTNDGYGLICPALAEKWSSEMGEHYLVSGFCTRNAFFKGMMFTFDFHSFCEEYGGKKIIKDVWGNEHHLDDVEMITTPSMLKLWDSYKSIDDYIEKSTANHYGFAVTKALPEKLENERNLNYQFIQSYELNDKQIEELISPTVSEIKDVISGDVNKTILFLKGMGLTADNINSVENDFAKAIMIDPRMLKDNYVINRLNYMLKKKKDEAKIGVLKIHGNYATISGDPVALCQKTFGIETDESKLGLLKAGEIYSEYWADLGVKEIVCFRAPMSAANNIRRMKIADNPEIRRWYKYMHVVNVLNAHDSFCHALNGCDFDGDALITTDNKVLLENTRDLPAIMCAQRKAEKKIITEELLVEANQNSFGDEIGTTTNHITAMYDLLPLFDKDSEEYKTLEYRIMCGQLYQQNCIDRTKGIISKPMPDYWYNMSKNKVKDNSTPEETLKKKFNSSICANKKPYFTNYIYPDQMTEYNQYIKSTNQKCRMLYQMDIAELEVLPEKTEEQNDFLHWYYLLLPVSDNSSTMNKICHKIEQEFDGYISSVKSSSDFDYSIMKSGVEYSKYDYTKIKQLYDEYLKRTVDFQIRSKQQRLDKEETSIQFLVMRDEFKRECQAICPNECELCDIILDMCYKSSHSKQFAWEICVDTIIHNLLAKNNNEISYVYKDKDGEIIYCGESFSIGKAKVETKNDNT